jgi:N6-adenosine-specific RNA methylase IME4
MTRLVVDDLNELVGVQKYRTIVADPPWPYRSPGEILRSSLEHRPNRDKSLLAKFGPGSKQRYGAMTIDQLKALPVPDLARDNAHLYLWTTNAFMVEAHEIAQAWGFTQKTIITWTKVHHADKTKPSMKTGYYFRGATEHVLFCVRGSMRLQTKKAYPTSLIVPRLPHSVKPDEFYQMVEECSPKRRLDMFARRKRKGWDAFGDELS